MTFTIKVPTPKSFWKWLMLFAYRRWAPANAMKPVGIPYNRDPEHPCEAFEPRGKKWQDWGRCASDGHYLCKDCCHYCRADDEEIIGLNLDPTGPLEQIRQQMRSVRY